MARIWVRLSYPSTGRVRILRALTSRFPPDVRAKLERHVENDLIEQRDSIQLDRPIAAIRHIEIADDAVDSKPQTLVELQGANAGGRRRDQQLVAIPLAAMAQRRLDKSGADSVGAPFFDHSQALQFEQPWVGALHDLEMPQQHAIPAGDEHLPKLPVAGNLRRRIIGFGEQWSQFVSRPGVKGNFKRLR
jgi:hypothetical protein